MDLATINSSTFTLTPQGGASVPGAISFHLFNKAAFDVTSPMAAGVTYTIRITTGAKDAAGNSMVSDFTSTFTTAGPPDVTPPTVTGISGKYRYGDSREHCRHSDVQRVNEGVDDSLLQRQSRADGRGVAIAATVSYDAPTKKS